MATRKTQPSTKTPGAKRAKAGSRSNQSSRVEFDPEPVLHRFRFEAELFEQITGALIDVFADLPTPPTADDISARVQAVSERVIKHFDGILEALKITSDASQTWLGMGSPQRSDPSALPRAVMQFMWAAFPAQLPPTHELPRAVATLQALSAKQIAMLREALSTGFDNLEQALLKAANDHTPVRSGKELYALVSRCFESSLADTYNRKPYANLIAELANQYATVYELSRANSAPWLQALGLPSANDTKSLTEEIAALRQAVDKLTPQVRPGTPKQSKSQRKR